MESNIRFYFRVRLVRLRENGVARLPIQIPCRPMLNSLTITIVLCAAYTGHYATSNRTSSVLGPNLKFTAKIRKPCFFMLFQFENLTPTQNENLLLLHYKIIL